MLANTTKFISDINKKPSRMKPQIAYLIEWVVRKYNNNTIVEPDSKFFYYHLGSFKKPWRLWSFKTSLITRKKKLICGKRNRNVRNSFRGDRNRWELREWGQTFFKRQSMIRDYLLRSCCNSQNCLARREVPLHVINSIVLQSFMKNGETEHCIMANLLSQQN